MPLTTVVIRSSAAAAAAAGALAAATAQHPTNVLFLGFKCRDEYDDLNTFWDEDGFSPEEEETRGHVSPQAMGALVKDMIQEKLPGDQEIDAEFIKKHAPKRWLDRASSTDEVIALLVVVFHKLEMYVP